ncbi:hypothetical protein [Parapedobacter tibetensis]|uniref:hypothetical protein n=1 Tax=Parapedobacter tibetensis TaxID=2972951 RepID=UPI00214D55D6|nr:hypothetical protein [Parapedobacter tibetensis]
MDRFYQYWQKYCPDLPEEVRQFIDVHHEVASYTKGQVIKLPDDSFPYFCVVLEGLVGGYQQDRARDPTLRELMLPPDFFTGTEHLFTTRGRHMEYCALEKTVVMRLSLADAKAGQQRHAEIAELFHVLKQKKIDLLRKLVAVYQETAYYDRYCVYIGLFKTWASLLPNKVQQQLLRMSETTYYRVKKQYLKGH